MFKKTANLILIAEEEDDTVYFDNLNLLLSVIDAQPKLVDLYNWLHISARFYEHLRHIKTKSSIINVRI